MKKSQHGFTLVELMLVVAIIAILASIALPAYTSYAIRAQIAEGLHLTGPIKYAIAQYYNDNGVFPVDNDDAALEAASSYSGKYVFSISVNGAAISIQYGNDANAKISGQTVTLTAVHHDGSVSWVCAGDGVLSTVYLPSSCK